MNAISKTRGGSVAVADAADAFTAYGASTQRSPIIGTLLKFNKGHWLAGESSEQMPANYELVALMDELVIGWQRWEDNRPAEQAMGKIVDGFQPPSRDSLGYLDKAQWETDATGKPRDPWQRTNMLLLVSPKNGDVYTFATSSVGGINAIGALAGIYGKGMRQKPDAFPVIALGSDSYRHKDASVGLVFVPAFKVTRWVAKAIAIDALEAAQGADPEPIEEEPAPAPEPSKPAKRAPRF